MIKSTIINISRKIHNIRYGVSYPPRNIEVTVKRQGLIWNLDLTSCIAESMYYNGYWEKNSTKLVKKIVRKGDVVFDIGANIGYYSCILSRLVGNKGHIYCFEPISKYVKRLKDNIKVNDLRNITVVKKVVSDICVPQKLQVGPSSARTFCGLGEYNHTEVVESITLDKYITEENGIRRVDFVKIDVDGFEIEIISGAEDTLRKYKPIMLVEFCPEAQEKVGNTTGDLLKLLQSFGYSLYSEYTGIEYKREYDFLKELSLSGSGSINVICIPYNYNYNSLKIKNILGSAFIKTIYWKGKWRMLNIITHYLLREKK